MSRRVHFGFRRKGKSIRGSETFTEAQALALLLVYYVADWACVASRTTVIDFTGRHQLGRLVANNLVKRGLLRDALDTSGYRWRTHLKITGRGQKAVRALERIGWTQEWLKENQRPTKAERIAKILGGAS